MCVINKLTGTNGGALLAGPDEESIRKLLAKALSQASKEDIPSLVFSQTDRLLSYVDPFTSPVCFWDMEKKAGLPFSLSLDQTDPLLLKALFSLPLPQQEALQLLLSHAAARLLPVSTLSTLENLCEQALDHYEAFTEKTVPAPGLPCLPFTAGSAH